MSSLPWRRPTPPSICFISHSYGDAAGLRNLLSQLPRGVSPFIFPAINVSPDERVSDDLIAAILKCPGLIYLKTFKSSESVWVTFERDYALRSGLAVYSFDPSTGQFEPDTSEPLELHLYPIFSRSHQDRSRVEGVRDFMKANRHFDVWDSPPLAPGLDFATYFEAAISERLDKGGYAVMFVSRRSLQSRGTMREFSYAAGRWPERILPALLDNIDAQSLPEAIRHVEPVELFKLDAAERAVNWNGVDDLIVRIFHLVYKNRELPLLRSETVAMVEAWTSQIAKKR